MSCALLAAPAPLDAAESRAEPRKLSAPAVPYPSSAHGDAEVVLDLTIAEDGTVAAARLLRGRNPFAREARAAAMTWRFTPAERNGVPTRSRVSVRVLFKDPVPLIPALAALSSTSTLSSAGPPEADALDPTLLDGEGASEEVVIFAERRSEIGGTFIPQEESRQIPGTFADPFRVVEVLPGIAPIVSGLPYFFVRGAPPGNVGYFIDGIRVPLLFHVGAGPSIMAPSLIDRVDVVPSAYSARFGRAAGGIIVGETTPSRGVARGEFQARAFDASGLLELPLGAPQSSVVVGGRYSYVQPLLDRVAPDYALGYWDYQARLNYQVDPTDVLTIFAFGAADKLESRVLERELLDTTFHRLDLRWDHASAENATRVALTGSLDRAANAEDDPVDFASRLESRGVRLRASSSQFISRGVTLRMGGDAGLDQIENDRSVQDGRIDEFPARTDLSGSAYFDAILTATGVEVVPGLRVEGVRWRDKPYLLVEPRLASKLRLWRSVAWVSQLGVTHQFPTQSVRIPGQASDPVERSVQEAWQAVQAVEFGSSSILLGRLGAFHSWIDAHDEALTARSYGIEAFLRREFAEGVGGILSYTLSRTETTLGRDTIPSEFDRTHVLSAVLGWNMGKGVRLGLRGYYMTGQHYSVLCPTPDCGPAPMGATPRFPRLGRLPGFYRADLRFEKRWDLGPTSWVAVALEWFNATLSREWTFAAWSPEAGRIVQTERDPLTLPSLGIEGGF